MNSNCFSRNNFIALKFSSLMFNKRLRILNLNNKRTSKSSADDRYIRGYNEIPGPKALPLIGNSWRFLPVIGQHRIEKIDVMSKQLREQYGDIVKVDKILSRPDMVLLFDAEQIEKVFRNEDTLPFRPSMSSLNYYKHVLRKDFFGDEGGVIAVHGENWLKFRTKVQQPILQPQIAKLYINVIEETAELFVSRIRKIRRKNNEVGENFLNDIHLWSLESIAQIALDIKLGCLDDAVRKDTEILIAAIHTFFANVAILEFKVPFWKIFNTRTWKKCITALDTMRNVTMKYITQALEKKLIQTNNSSNENASLLQRILELDPKNPKLATILALDMFLVGIDTTSAAVASILYQLSQHQDKQHILFNEICSILPNRNDKLTTKELQRLIYLKAFIKETFRMYPVVLGNGRCLTKEMEICGYQVPKGVHVIFQHYVISNSEHYFKNANKFEPERWLKHNKEQTHAFASLPFGFGKRMCLGRRFAELEIQILIAKLVQNFHIEYTRQPLEYEVQPLYLPKGPLSFTFSDRT